MIDDLDDRVHRRCSKAAGAILTVLDGTELSARQRKAVRRAVMAAIHDMGDDVAALVRGVVDEDAEFGGDWLAGVGFGTGEPTPSDDAMHRALVPAREDDAHGTPRPVR